MEKRILVVDSPTSTRTEYFERTFANSVYDIRIITDSSMLPPLLKSLRFSYIFIGDMIDITWLSTYMWEGTAYIVLYSTNQQLVEKQSKIPHACSIVPFQMINRFISQMEILGSSEDRSIHPSDLL